MGHKEELKKKRGAVFSWPAVHYQPPPHPIVLVAHAVTESSASDSDERKKDKKEKKDKKQKKVRGIEGRLNSDLRVLFVRHYSTSYYGWASSCRSQNRPGPSSLTISAAQEAQG